MEDEDFIKKQISKYGAVPLIYNWNMNNFNISIPVKQGDSPVFTIYGMDIDEFKKYYLVIRLETFLRKFTIDNITT